jgi:serine/threonine protein kinase
MIATDCPQEQDLLALVSDGSADSSVHDHVEGCPHCRLRLARLNAEVAALRGLGELVTGSFGSPPSPDPGEEAGAARNQIGKYHVLEALGRGGQADVYRAIHPALGKEVVIKLGRETCREDRGVLVEEAKVLAALDHPGLARIYDLDFHEGRPFLVMEYVPACNLRQFAARNRLTPRQAAGLTARVVRAVAAAHDRGVVHQDLKPDNVLVDSSGNPRVIDFGLARLVHAWADPLLQPEGGTISYMAPEQARGESDRVGPRSDLFALGGVLYFLLSGQAPFPGATCEERLERARRCDFDQESLASGPRKLRAICLWAMAADPMDRPASAAELASALERFATGSTRRRVLWASGGAAVLAAVGFGWWRIGTKRPDVAVRGDSPPIEALPEPPPPLPDNPLTFRLSRGDEIRDITSLGHLAHFVPLRGGDELQIHAAVPLGLHAALFSIGSGGRLRWLAGGEPGLPLHYPAGASEFVPLEGDGGTEVVLVCWRRSGPAGAEELERLWGSTGAWPALAPDTVLRFDREGVSVVQKGRPLGAPRERADPEGEVRLRLERFGAALRDHFDRVVGVAFAYKR